MSTIYTLSVFEDMTIGNGTFSHTPTNTIGWFREYKDAKRIVKDNIGDIWETCFTYALIEELQEGLYSYMSNRWLFKYNPQKDQYEYMEIPKEMEPFVNFSIG